MKRIPTGESQKGEGPAEETLREICLLGACSHPNVLAMRDLVWTEDRAHVYIVTDRFPHDLARLLYCGPGSQEPFGTRRATALFRQLLEGLAYMHERDVMHRDIKPSNLLVDAEDRLRICDFGFARRFDRSDGERRYSPVVVTLWYRAPEVLLGAESYGPAVDVWAAGCVLAEMLRRKPLLQGKNETDQIAKTCEALGPFSEASWPGWSSLPHARKLVFPRAGRENRLNDLIPSARRVDRRPLVALLRASLRYPPSARPSASEALRHACFRTPAGGSTKNQPSAIASASLL